MFEPRASRTRPDATLTRVPASTPAREAAEEGVPFRTGEAPVSTRGAEAPSGGGRQEGPVEAVQAMADVSPRVSRQAQVQAMGNRAAEGSTPILQGRFALVGVAPEADRGTGRSWFGRFADWIRGAEGAAPEAGPVAQVLAALQSRRAWLIQQDDELRKTLPPGRAATHRPAREVLDDNGLKAAVGRMYTAETDHGSIDLSNPMVLLQFFYRLTLELGPGQAPAREETEARAEAEHSNEAWKNWVEGVARSNDVGEDHIFRTVVLGRGASAAFVIENGGVPLDETTLVIGREQPWRKERGEKGVINHPHNMIDPEHSRFDDTDDGLAGRGEFSDRVDKVFLRLARKPLDAEVKRVEKKGSGAGAHYEIQTDPGHPIYAQHVVAAMGIGKHARPKNLESDVNHNLADPEGKSESIPRIMDMDEFQRLMAERRLHANNLPNGIVVVGPNAAIDVMSTALRSRVKDLYWIAGKRPFFLKGTDNEFVEQKYDEAMKHQQEGRTEKDKRYSKDGFTIIMSDHLGAKTTEGGVTAEFGIRGNDRASPKVAEESIGTVEASILVYGIGPDVESLMKIFPDATEKTLEPVYDLGLHFNEDLPSAWSITDQIAKQVEDRKGKEEAIAVVGKIQGILGGLLPGLSTAPRTDIPKTLPSVLGLRTRKDDPADQTSLEFTSGMAYRFAVAARPRYRYLSTQLDGDAEGEIQRLSDTVQALTIDMTTQPLEVPVSGLALEIKGVATEARALVEELENGRQPEGLDEALIKLFGRAISLKKPVDDLTRASEGITREAAVEAGHHARDLPPRLVQIVQQIREFSGYVANNRYGHLASSHMEAPALTLPANVVLADQLTTSRATVESRQEKLPANIAEGIDFITHDHTLIADHVAAAYPTIPPLLADYITAKIVYDRRFLPLDEAPLPRPKEALGPENTFHLEQQKAFQKNWTKRLRQISALLPEG
jgi:hypothetical protein